MNTLTIDPRAQALVEQALQAGGGNDAERALELLRQAMALEPSWAIPYFLTGAELAQAGRVEEAEGALASAVVLAPDFAIARFQLGLLQFTAQRVAQAILTWQPLLGADPPTALGSFVQGFAALAGDHFEAALQHFGAGLEANQDNPPLNADIHRLMQRIEALAPGAQADVHMLLANYHAQGSLH